MLPKPFSFLSVFDFSSMKKESAQMAAIPHLFRCPISLDLFKDPVTLCTGQTYERSSIEKWLATGKLTCPVTMQHLPDLSIVPNHTLRHLIDQWLQMDHHQIQGDVDHQRLLTTIDPDHHSLAALKHNLESNESTLIDKLQALERTRFLCNEFPSTISCFIQLDFLSLLIKLVFDTRLSLEDSLKFSEQALSCIIKLLPFGEFGCLNMLNEEHNLSSFLALFKQGNTKINTSLCQLVEVISASLETQELCANLGQNRQLLHTIILLLDHQNSETSAESGIKAISALCSLESSRENLVKEGAVDALITYILRAERSETSLAPMAMASLEVLLGGQMGKEALINNPNGVNALVKMVFRVSDHQGSESAVNSLMMVCGDSIKAIEEGVCAGVLTQLLLLLQSQCNGRTKTKARMLLKLLRSMWIENPKHIV